MSPSRWNSRGIRSWLFALTLAMVAPGLAVAAPSALAANPPGGTQIVDGPNGFVYASAQGGDGTTYLGGDFTWWGAQTGAGAAVRTDNAEVRRNFPKVTGGDISAVAPDGMGGYYIGGNFDRVAGVTRERLAHILPSGALDPDWDVPADNTVSALAVSGSRVYVGGDFTAVDGDVRYYLAAVTTAGALDPDWHPNPDGVVRSLVASDSGLYVGGAFASIGGESRNNLALLDLAGSGDANVLWNPNVDGAVMGLALSGPTLFVGGAFGGVGTPVTTSRNNLAAVSATGSGAVDPDWNPDANGQVNTLAVSGSTLVVGGEFSNLDNSSPALPNLAKVPVDGVGAPDTDWTPNPDATVRTVAISGSTVYAGGDFSHIGSDSRGHLASMTLAGAGAATSWNPNSQGGVSALVVQGATVYAGGGVSMMGGQEREYLAAVTSAGTLDPDWHPNADGVVKSLVASDSGLYVGGSFASVGGQFRNNLALLDLAGSGDANASWNPNVDGEVSALALSESTLFVGGAFGGVGSAPATTRNHLAAVSATGTGAVDVSWNPNANGEVKSMALSGSSLYVGGGFTTLGGAPQPFLAEVSASGSGATLPWNPEPDEVVNAIAVADTTVYVGGDFTLIGATNREKLAAIGPDGEATAWIPDGANASVNALAAVGSTVYVGGGFSQVGGVNRSGLAAIDTAGSGTVSDNWNPAPAASPDAASIISLAATASSVRVGGYFTTIGPSGTPSGTYYAVLPAAAGPPGQPTKVTGTAGDGSVALSWSAPTDTNGGSVTGYRIEIAPGPSYSTWTVVDPNTGSASTSHIIIGVTNGTNYVARVSAINVAGTGSPSAASTWFRPMVASVVPAAPTGVSAVPGSSRLTASWSASSSPGTGATAIIRYRAVALNANGVVAGYCQSEAVSSPDTTCVIKGLTPGVSYTVKVRAWNNLGKFGDFSTASTPAQPTT